MVSTDSIKKTHISSLQKKSLSFSLLLEMIQKTALDEAFCTEDVWLSHIEVHLHVQ